MEKEEKVLNVLVKAVSKYEYELVADLAELLGPFDLSKPQMQRVVNRVIHHADSQSKKRIFDVLLESGLDLEKTMWSASFFSESVREDEPKISIIDKLLKNGDAALCCGLLLKKGNAAQVVLQTLETFESQRIQRFHSYKSVYGNFFESSEQLAVLLSLEGFNINKIVDGVPLFFNVKSAQQLEQCINAGANIELSILKDGGSFIHKLKDIKEKEERLKCFEVYEKWRKKEVSKNVHISPEQKKEYVYKESSAIESTVGRLSVGITEIKKMLKIAGLTFESFQNEKKESLAVVILQKKRWDLLHWLEKEKIDILQIKDAQGNFAWRHLFESEYGLKGKKIDEAKMKFLQLIKAQSIKSLDVIAQLKDLPKENIDRILVSRYLKMQSIAHPEESLVVALKALDRDVLLPFEVNRILDQDALCTLCDSKTLSAWMRTLNQVRYGSLGADKSDIDVFKKVIQKIPKDQIQKLVNPDSLALCWLKMLESAVEKDGQWSAEKWYGTWSELISFCAQEANVATINLDFVYPTLKKSIASEDRLLQKMRTFESAGKNYYGGLVSMRDTPSIFKKTIEHTMQMTQDSAFALFFAIGRAPEESYEKVSMLKKIAENILEKEVHILSDNALKDNAPLAPWVLALKEESLVRMVSACEKLMLGYVSKDHGGEKLVRRL